MAIRILRLAIAAVDRQVAEKWLFHCGARAGVLRAAEAEAASRGAGCWNWKVER